MSGLKFTRTVETWVEVQAECRECGSGLLSDCTPGAWQDRPVGADNRIVVKVSPCARCARERKEAKA